MAKRQTTSEIPRVTPAQARVLRALARGRYLYVDPERLRWRLHVPEGKKAKFGNVVHTTTVDCLKRWNLIKRVRCSRAPSIRWKLSAHGKTVMAQLL